MNIIRNNKQHFKFAGTDRHVSADTRGLVSLLHSLYVGEAISLPSSAIYFRAADCRSYYIVTLQTLCVATEVYKGSLVQRELSAARLTEGLSTKML